VVTKNQSNDVVAIVPASSSAQLTAQRYWSEAATKIQSLVRANHQRRIVQRTLSFHLQGTKVSIGFERHHSIALIN
jgi:hypothetical protein